MKQQANQMRPGWVIDFNGKQYMVTKINIITPGKGGAFIQVEMRDVLPDERQRVLVVLYGVHLPQRALPRALDRDAARARAHIPNDGIRREAQG